MRDKYKEINVFLKERIKENDSLVLACSGGPDSMCLLDILIKYRRNTKINIIVAHVNHNVRKESDDELLFVKDYCEKNSIIFEVMKIEKYSDSNFESEARDKRYKFFSKLQEKYNAKYILTAHHGDDLMETILMRISRGSSLKGYSGFEREKKMNDYSIIRPLIMLTKKDILEYNKENKIPYVNDYTNELDVHTRNRYRKYILPKLKEEDSNINLKYYKFSTLLNEYDDYVNKNVIKIIKKIYVSNVLDVAKFLKYDSFIQKRIIMYILNIVYQDDINKVDDKNVNDICNLLNLDRPNVSLNLPKHKLAIKSYNNFSIIDNVDKKGYRFELNKKQMLPNGKIIEQVNAEESNSNNVCRLNSKDIKLPIIIRTRESGDTISVMNMNGSKKVKDIFIDAKIPMLERDTWPIVIDSDSRVLWIPGIKKSKYNKQIKEKCDIILKYY